MPYWVTHDNGGRPFLVYQQGDQVIVLNIHDETKLVKRYVVEKVFVGKSPLNPTTAFSGGHGKDFDGNSILLQLPGNRYVFIGERVYEFSPPEPIIKYYSTVGNNDVPYPIALSENLAFFMLDPPRRFGEPQLPKIDYVAKSALEPVKDWSDAYTEYYARGKKNVKQLPIKVIEHRPGWPLPRLSKSRSPSRHSAPRLKK